MYIMQNLTEFVKRDFEKMSEILLRVDKVCSGLAKAGRANEIPPEAYKIANYTQLRLDKAGAPPPPADGAEAALATRWRSPGALRRGYGRGS